jgi:GT2 family glycosyltransferase
MQLPLPTQTDVTVVLNGFRRPQRLMEQVDALRGQSIQPVEIMYWQNTYCSTQYDINCVDTLTSAVSNENFGVWSRFAYALNANTTFVCVFDDDTIPGSKWLENCLRTYSDFPGLLGSNGVIFLDRDYQEYQSAGWRNPNHYPKQVDIVGHSWFFERKLLSFFWREIPTYDRPAIVGEDIHFSYMLQKYSRLKTYVPAHPAGQLELWGSLKGNEYGRGPEAISMNEAAMRRMGQYLRNSAAGFRCLRT